MALFGRGRGRIEPDQQKALDHPMRLRIMELFTKDEDRPLAAEPLAADLAPDFPDVSLSQVMYHVSVLRDAQLLPASL